MKPMFPMKAIQNPVFTIRRPLSMVQIASSFLLLLVAAPLFLGSHAFQNVGTSGVSWATSTNKLQTADARNYIRFINSKDHRSIVLLHESLTGSDEVASEENKDVEENKDATNERGTTAATNTINERLMAELQEAEETERFGAKGKKMSLVDGYGRTRKSDAEMKVAIAEARDLNGVNPWLSIVGSFFAFGVAAALWFGTNKLGGYFASHPPVTEVYFVQRTAQVFRNVVMGMISLASGFFGVTGLGIFGMGVRVAYGVMTGELDPTPIKNRSTPAKKSVDMGSMMDLMMNKKPGRRGGKKK
jgi:hypothetical protein